MQVEPTMHTSTACRGRVAVGRLLDRRKVGQVEARAEPASCAGQHDHTRRIVLLDHIERGVQVLDQRNAHRVEPFGPFQQQQPDALVGPVLTRHDLEPEGGEVVVAGWDRRGGLGVAHRREPATQVGDPLGGRGSVGVVLCCGQTDCVAGWAATRRALTTGVVSTGPCGSFAVS